jgi:hypothetical protein
MRDTYDTRYSDEELTDSVDKYRWKVAKPGVMAKAVGAMLAIHPRGLTFSHG